MAKIEISKERAARIAKATLAFERRLPTRQDQRPLPPDSADGFWLELTSEDDPGSYSWKLVYPSATDSEGWIDASPAVTGDHAYEANGATGLAHTPHRFFAKFIGYDTDDVAYYIFVAGGAAPAGTTQWFKVLYTADAHNVLVAQPWDGITAGDPHYVYAYRHFEVDDTFYATKVNPLVNVHPVEDATAVVDFLQLPDGKTSGAITLAGTGAASRTATWKRSVDGTPITIQHQRIYIDSSAKTITAYEWYEKFDADGLLYEVTEESAVNLNTGANCG